MHYEAFLQTLSAPAPPQILSEALQALWFCKNNQWEAAHNIAQDLHSPAGSWIHALLHLIEGDTGNAAYWFHRANQPVRRASEIDRLWETIARSLCITDQLT